MSQSASPAGTIDALFARILNFLLPFYITAADLDVPTAQAAILKLIEAYTAATAAELDIVGRLIGYGAAAMDSLRQSMRAGLSDRKILQCRANAVALGRSAEQCRMLLEAMQAKREPVTAAGSMPPPPPMPSPRPPSVSPLPQSPPPPKMPPAKPQGSQHAAPAVQAKPGIACDSTVIESDVRAIIASLHAAAADLGPGALGESLLQIALHASHPLDQDPSGIT